MSKGHDEREVKLSVWPGFSLPSLDDVVDGGVVERAADLRLEATYYDTPDLRLARAGITLRHRLGEGEPRWTLKLPRPSDGVVITRRELDVPGDGRTVPAELASLVRGRSRSAALGPVARLQTLRRPVRVRREEGAPWLVEIVDDEVSVLDGRRVALRFREVEVELAPEAPEGLLDELVRRLRAAGAGPPDPVPKAIRALGPVASAPSDPVEPRPSAEPTAGEVLTRGLVRSVRRLLECDVGLRLGEDPEAVHQARVATRRLRSDLRAYRSLVEGAWAAPLREELSWLADVLGGVRDADVLLARLRGHVGRLDPADREPAEELVAVLEGERAAHRLALLEAIDEDRYAALLEQLVTASAAPELLPIASRPAAEVLPALAAEPWRALAKSAGRVTRRTPDRQLHAIRIRAKRARYAAEVAALVVGKPAQRLADAVAEVQDVLGEHQDAVVAQTWLRRQALLAPSAVAMVAGQLMEVERAEASKRRAAFPAVWERANRGRLRGWLP